MEEENLAQEFNELSDFAHQILSKVDVKLAETRSELEETRQAFGNTFREAEDLKSELSATKQNLSAELAKTQQACRDLEEMRKRIESERDYLRKEFSRINELNKSLQNSLIAAQTELRELRGVRAEVMNLRSKLEQIRRVLAG